MIISCLSHMPKKKPQKLRTSESCQHLNGRPVVRKLATCRPQMESVKTRQVVTRRINLGCHSSHNCKPPSTLDIPRSSSPKNNSVNSPKSIFLKNNYIFQQLLQKIIEQGTRHSLSCQHSWSSGVNEYSMITCFFFFYFDSIICLVAEKMKDHN